MRGLFIYVLIVSGLALPTDTPALRITHVNVIDATGRDPIVDTSVHIRDDRIVEISQSPGAEGEEVLDGEGAFALPGLIDAHTHLASIPGSQFRNDSAEVRECLWENQMHAYVAAGVTSVLDNAASRDFIIKVNRFLASGGVGPRFFYLAPMLTPPGGYFSDESMRGETYADLWSPVSTEAQVAAHLEHAAGLKPTGVKVVIEEGFGPIGVWSIHRPEMRDAIREEAHRRGMPLFIHSMSNDAHRIALKMRPRALVHSSFSGETPEPAVLAAMKAQQVFVVSTVAPFEFLQLQWRQSELDSPLIQMTVPEVQIGTAKDSTAWEWQNDTTSEANTPRWVPTLLRRWMQTWFYSESILAEQQRAALRNLKLLHEAGIQIVMGSDSGNWPAFLSLFHGPERFARWN